MRYHLEDGSSPTMTGPAFGRRSTWLLVGLAVIGSSLTLLTWRLVAEQEALGFEAHFQQDSQQHVTAVERALYEAEASLWSLEGLFAGSQQVTRAEFSTFAAIQLRRHPFLAALEWIPRIPAERREQHESAARAEGYADYSIHALAAAPPADPAPPRDVHHPVFYTEPLAGNERAVGLDLSSDPLRAAALAEAEDSAGLAATPVLHLVQDSPPRPAVLLVVPHYGPGIPRTVADRRSTLRGFLLGALRVDDLVRHALGEEPSTDIALSIQELGQEAPRREIHASGPVEDARLSQVRYQRILPLGSRRWAIVCSPTASYLRQHRSRLPLFALAGGALTTLFALLFLAGERRAAAELWRAAYFDTLTRLPNRAHLLVELTRAEERLKARDIPRYSMLFVDVDRFKLINDSLGHAAGDELLCRIAERLRALIRPGDLLARNGGDEFAILFLEFDNEEARKAADRIREDMKLPFQLRSGEVFLSMSVGIAAREASHEPLGDPSDLLRDADIAMYRAKLAGREGHVVFDTSMRDELVRHQGLERDLRRAVEGGQLTLYFQPIVALSTGGIHGFEALVRWLHPAEGLLLPEEFIGLAEESGLIKPVGKWVLSNACLQLSEWQKRFPAPAGSPRLTLQVNVSSRQLHEHGFLAALDEALSTSGLDPEDLILEVTESIVLRGDEHTLGVLAELRARRVHICLDDFGTGYSSLSTLHRLPFDALKVDKSFVTRLGQARKDSDLVRTMLLLGEQLGASVTVEGVETPEQLRLLKGMGCEYAQGFHFSPPLTAEAAIELLGRPLPWLREVER